MTAGNGRVGGKITKRSASTGRYISRGSEIAKVEQSVPVAAARTPQEPAEPGPADRGELVSRMQMVVALVVEALGGVTAASRILQVSKSQPSRWRAGIESPSPAKARELLDLDHVIARAELMWGDGQVVLDWLTGSNSHLGGATPLNVIRTRGVTEVIEALDEEMSGAYA